MNQQVAKDFRIFELDLKMQAEQGGRHDYVDPWMSGD